jgi:hypothetical protein
MVEQNQVTLAGGEQAHTITIFPQMTGGGCGGGACGCGPSNRSDPVADLIREMDKARLLLDKPVRVEKIEYATGAQLAHAINRLDSILKVSTGEDSVSHGNLHALLMYSTPIVAIDERVVAAGYVPAIGEIEKHLQSRPSV